MPYDENGGAPTPKIRVYQRRAKASQKHAWHPPAAFFVMDKRKPAHTPRKGQTWQQASMPQYRVPGSANSWTWENPAAAKRIASRFKKGQR